LELIFFIYLIILGCLVLFTESKQLLKYVYVPSIFIFLIIVRLSGYDVDIQHYADAMLFNSDSIYYVKEFIFWYSQRYLYLFLQNDLLVFFIMDIFWIYIIIQISNNLDNDRNMRLKGGFIIILISSFPFFFGYENIYRQFFGTIFVLWSYSYIDRDRKKAILIFLISIFIHNIMILLLPILIMKASIKKKYKLSISLLITMIFILLLDYMSKFKSGHATGEDLSIVYLIMFLIILYLFIIKLKFNINTLILKFPSLLITIFYMISLQHMKFDMITERLGMIFLVFLLYDMYDYSNSLFGLRRNLFRICLLIVFSVPVLFFSSARSFF
jgi:hypothetical protein